MNHITLSGRVGQDPQQPIENLTKFSFAHENRYFSKKDNDWIGKTSWFEVACWGKLSEYAMKKVRKGDWCVITGPLEIDQYETQSGEKRTKVSIRATGITFAPKPRQNQDDETRQAVAQHEEQQAGFDPNEEIPF